MVRVKPSLLLIGAGLTMLLPAAGYAQVPVPDPQIFVCTGCIASPGGDPDFINPASINVGFDGSHTAISPLLILVGVPDAGPIPTISLPAGVNPAASGSYYGLNNATTGTTAGAFEGTLTSTSSDAYTTAGLTAGAGGGASESFVNWTTTPFPNGNANADAGVTTFNIYAYGIDVALDSTGDAGQNSPITIDFSNIAAGTYVIAYNCATAGPTCSDGNIGATPFTNAGDVGVPEPASLALLGTALVSLGLIRRRRRKSA